MDEKKWDDDYYVPDTRSATTYSTAAPNYPPSYQESDPSSVAPLGGSANYGTGYGSSGLVDAAPPVHDSSQQPLTSDEHFTSGSGYKDVLFTVLFVVHVAVLILIAIVNGHHLKRKAFFKRASDRDLFFGVLTIAAILGVGFTGLYMIMMRKFARFMIWFFLLATVVLNAMVAIAGFASGLWGVGIVFAIVTVVNIVYVFLVRRRIPFSQLILETSLDIIFQFPATLWTQAAALVFMTGWCMFWAFVMIATLGLETSDAKNAQIMFLLFSLFWSQQVVQNVVHVTVAGTVSTWYFNAGNMPPDPTKRSLKRAMTTSFGSICLGSLVVAVIRTLRALVMSLRQQRRNDLLVVCLDCILRLLDRLVTLFNRYAYVHVAMYGKSFVESAKDTWQLICDRGIEVIINDDLTGTVLFFGALIGGLVTGSIGGAWADHKDAANYGTYGFFAFCVGFLIVALGMMVVQSAIATIFVAFAEEPRALEQTKPDLHNAFMSNYQGVTV